MANFIIWATPGTAEVVRSHYRNLVKAKERPSHTYQSFIWHTDKQIDPKEAIPPRWCRTLGPYQLASWLRGHGYTVKIIDFCLFMTTDQLVRITEKHIDNDTLAIGASTSFWQMFETVPQWAIDARIHINKKFKNIKWCLGGHGANRFQLQGWEVLQGEGENVVLRWLDELAGKKMFRQPFDIKETSNAFMPDDFIQPYEFIPVELGRGCKFKCKFCQFPNIGKKPGTYLKNYECLYREILDHHNKWGTTRFYYTDDTVNESEEKIQALVDIAQRVPFKLEWIGYNRIDLIWSKPHTAELLKESGLRSAFFGIESFERKSSLLIGRGWSGLHAKDWLLELKDIWKDQINWSVATIVGVPGQTPEQLINDCDWMIENKMYSCTMHALHINPSNTSLMASQSEFERNYQEYGFQFPDPARPWYWENGFWNYDKALAMTDLLLSKTTKHQKLASWELGEYASLGYSVDELINVDQIKLLHDQEIFTKSWNFIENYVTKNLL